MNIGKGAAIAAVIFAGLVGVGGIGFGYQEFRKSEAQVACQSVIDQINAIQSLSQAEQMKKIAGFDETAIDNCIAKFEAIPFKSAEQKASAKQMERAIAYLPLVKGLAGFASAFSTESDAGPQNSSPSAADTTLVATAQPGSFDSLTPCDQLDALAKSGKSVSEFLIASAKVNSLGKYQSAISSTCPWNAEQLQVADRVLNPPVIVTAPVVTVSSGSSAGGSVRSSSSGSWVPPAPVQGWNNCNGIQEPGESYSRDCHIEQLTEAVEGKKMEPIPYPQPKKEWGYNGSADN